MAEDYSQYAENIGDIGGRVERAKRKALDIKPADRGAKVSDVQNVTKKLDSVLTSLNQFVKRTGSVIKNNAEQITAAARENAKQYSQAVKEDVRVDKQNLVATALSSATPIFGYFASKFMETDVWNKFAGKKKKKLVGGLKEGFNKAKEYSKTLLAPITEKIKGVLDKIGGVIGSLGSGVRSLIPGLGGGKGTEIPKLAKGGYIGDTGLAKIHPAEVVAPSEQILKQMRKTAVSSARAQEGIVEKLNRNFRNFVELQRERTEQTSQQMRLMRQQLGGEGRESSIKQFFTDFKKFYQGRLEENLGIQQKILNAVSMIRNSLVTPVGGILDALQYSFNNFLFNHPIFRNLFRFTKTAISTAFRIPGAILRIRGNYQAQMRGVGGTPMERTAMILGMLYPPLLHKLDQIILAIRGEEEGKTGWRLAGSPIRIIQSMLQGGKKGLAEDKAQAERKGGSVPPIGAIGGGAGGLAKGIGEELGLGRPARWLKEKTEGMTAAGREKQQERRQLEVRNRFEPIPTMLETLDKKLQPISTFYTAVTPWEILGPNGISWNLEAIKDQSRRTRKGIKDITKETGVTARRVRKVSNIASNTERTAEYTKDTREATETVSRRLGLQSMMRFFGMVGSVVSSATSAITGSLANIASILAAGLGAGGMAARLSRRGAGPGQGVGALLSKGVRKLGGGKLLPGLVRGGGILAGGKALYSGITAGMSPSKMLEGVDKGEAGAQERASAATGAILGGKGKGGWGQAAGQAGKWGSIGAMIGSFVAPGVGTALGGGAGALAGGIMGLIGGDKIASATNSLIEGSKKIVGKIGSGISSVSSFIWDKVKAFGSRMWNSITAPFKMLYDVGEKINSWISNKLGFNLGEAIWDKVKSIGSNIWNAFTSPVESMMKLSNKIGDWIGNKVSGAWNYITDKIPFVGGEKEKEKTPGEKAAKEKSMIDIPNIGSTVKKWVGNKVSGAWGSIKSNIPFVGGEKEKEKTPGEKAAKEKSMIDIPNIGNVIKNITNIGSTVKKWVGEKVSGVWGSIKSNIPFVGGEKEKEKTPGEKAVENKDRTQVVTRVMGTARNVTPKQEDVSKAVEEVIQSPTLDRNRIAALKNLGVNLESKEVKEVVNKLYQSTEDLKKLFAESAKSNNALIQNVMNNMQSSQSNTQQNSGGGGGRSTGERDHAAERVYNGDVF